MAIVQDPFDPSGMFSKAGRVSLEMFQLIQQKNEILFNEKKYYRPKLASFGLYDLQSLKNNNSDEAKLKDREIDAKEQKNKAFASTNALKPALNRTKTSKNEPFAKLVSREQANLLISKEKLNDKRFGMYHPRYNLVFKKSPLYFYENKEETAKHVKKKPKEERFSLKKGHKNSIVKGTGGARLSASKSRSASPQFPPQEKVRTLPDLPLKTSRKVPAPIALEKQLPRKDIFISALNEKRFEYLSLPAISSKVKRTPNISLKYGGRSEHNSVFANERSGLEYKPKYHLVFPKDGLMIPNFAKTAARKPNLHVCYTLNESSVVFDEYNQEDYSPIGKKIVGPLFDKMLSREMSLNESKNSSLQQNSVMEKKTRSEKLLPLVAKKKNVQ